MGLFSLNGNILAHPQTFEIEKTIRAGLAAPAVKTIRPVKVAYPYIGDKLTLSEGDVILIKDDILRQSNNTVKVLLGSEWKELLLVKESDVVAVIKNGQ